MNTFFDVIFYALNSIFKFFLKKMGQHLVKFTINELFFTKNLPKKREETNFIDFLLVFDRTKT